MKKYLANVLIVILIIVAIAIWYPARIHAFLLIGILGLIISFFKIFGTK